MYANNIFLQKTNNNFDYIINGQSLCHVEEIKDSGIIVSKDLSLKLHINSIYGRALKALEFIKYNCWEFSNINGLKVL